VKYEGQQPKRVGFEKYFSYTTSSKGIVIRDRELDAVKKYNLTLKGGMKSSFYIQSLAA
jgi:hypothetical protein